MINKVKEVSPSSELSVSDAGALSFRIKKENVDEMPKLIEFLEDNSKKQRSKRLSFNEKEEKESKVKEWGVSHTSLEEVFIQVTKSHGFDYEDTEKEEEIDENFREGKNNEDINVQLLEDSPLISNKKKLKSFSYRALLRKNFRLQMKQKGSNCCQIITPLLVLLILLIFQMLIKREFGESANTKRFRPSTPWPLNQMSSSVRFPVVNTTTEDLSDTLRKANEGQEYKFFYFSVDPSSVDDPGFLDENGNGTGLLRRIAQNTL